MCTMAPRVTVSVRDVTLYGRGAPVTRAFSSGSIGACWWAVRVRPWRGWAEANQGSGPRRCDETPPARAPYSALRHGQTLHGNGKNVVLAVAETAIRRVSLAARWLASGPYGAVATTHRTADYGRAGRL